jgi:hypothetical protein
MKSVLITSFVALASASGAANRTHYGDPNTHLLAPCLPDEVKAKITGLAGDLCIPPCDSAGKCPQDKPAGVTGTPQCVLKSSTGAQYCAVVCTPTGDDLDAQCGAHASCKQATKSGLCTYDDVPKPPSSQHWAPIDSPTFQAQSVCLAVGFTEDGMTGFAGAGSNGVGAQIIKSTDGGVTWAAPGNQSASFNIYLDAKAESSTHAVVSGVITQDHTVNGNTFIPGGPVLCPAQDIGVVPVTKEFALIAECTEGQGVYTSHNGSTYAAHIIPDSVLNSTAGAGLVRYGAFPSELTWYVAAGTFPNTNNDNNGYNKVHKKKRVTKYVTAAAESYEINQETQVGDGPVKCSEDPENCFAGAILKTTDGGKTWTKVWENINTGDNIYNNGIHCSSVDHCVAAVEGDSARILLTVDGGKTWTESMHDTDSASSLVAVHMLDEKEVWVSGGHMGNPFEGRFWHSLDGGKTFTKEAIPGLYSFSFDMTSKESGFSVCLTQSSGVQLLKYRHNNTATVMEWL